MRKHSSFLIMIIALFVLTTGNSFGQWIQSSNGLPASAWFYSFAVNGSNIFIGTSYTGVYRTTDLGSSWTQTSLNDTTVFSLTANGSNVFAGTQGKGVLISTNNGGSWTQTSLNNKIVMALANNGTSIFAGTLSSGVYKSSDNGSSWAQTTLNDKSVFSLAISGTNIFAGTSGSGVYVSTNSGINWTQTSLNDKTIYALTISGTTIYAGTSGAGVYKSTDNGNSWTQTSLTSVTVRSLASNGNNIFAGTTGSGVYFTSNSGANWVQKNQGITSITTIGALLIESNLIFAGNWAQNVWKRSLTEIIGIKNISSEVPAVFSLQQNYPNPFNPTTNIEFAIAKSGFVNLKVYDILGKEVITLVNETKSAGRYLVDFDGSNLTSGVYFYKLETNEFSNIKKMLMIK